MITRTFDADFINALANDPSVRPFVGWPELGSLDLSALLANPVNVALAVEDGAFIFHHDEPGRYQLHTMFLPQGRGAGVLPAFAEASRWMFVATDCEQIITQVAGSNRAADLMARRAGFKPMFKRLGAWADGSDITYYGLSLDDWREKDATLADEGQALHDALNHAKVFSGSELDIHPDDDAHDRAAGLACLMAKAGNPVKAVLTYNRWARFAGYQTISIIPAPPMFDIGDAVITFRNSTLEVLQCR